MYCTQHTLENHVGDKTRTIMGVDVCTGEGGGRLGLKLQARAASREIKQTSVGKRQEMS